MIFLEISAHGNVVRVVDEDNAVIPYRLRACTSSTAEAEPASDEDDYNDNGAGREDGSNEEWPVELTSDISAKVEAHMVSSAAASTVTCLRNVSFERAFCTTGTCHPPDRLFPSGVAWELGGQESPGADAFPFDFHVGSGITIVEVTTRTTDVGLTTNWFSPARVDAAVHALGLLDEHASLVGLVDDADDLLYLQEHTCPTIQNDPFLLRWDEAAGAVYESPLGAKTYLGVFVSNWNTVEDQIKHERGHDDQQPSHFYVVVRDSLPDAICDQARHVVKLRSEVHGEHWAQITARKELVRAKDLGRIARFRKLVRACEALEVSFDMNDISCTDTDLFGAFVIDDVAGDENPVFFSGASTSLQIGPGRAVFGNDGDSPPQVVWLHGPYTGTLGGGQWRSECVKNAVPETIVDLTDNTLGALVASGWDPNNGFVHMQHVCTVHHGARVPFVPATL
jgi:hypothetical protein